MIRPNSAEESKCFTEIILTNREGKERARTIVDKEFQKEIRDARWALSGNGYVVSNQWKGKKYVMQYLHHRVLPKKEGFDVDHINRNPLDNRRENLRYLTHRQNAYNNNGIGVVRVAKSGKRKREWMAYVGSGKHRKYLGYFETFREAKTVRDLHIAGIVG